MNPLRLSVWVAGLVVSGPLQASLDGNLPPMHLPTDGGGTDGDWLSLVRGYIADGAIVLGLALGVLGLLWIAYTALAKFNACRAGQAEWSELGVLGIAGAVVLLLVMFLLAQAAEVFG